MTGWIIGILTFAIIVNVITTITTRRLRRLDILTLVGKGDYVISNINAYYCHKHPHSIHPSLKSAMDSWEVTRNSILKKKG